MLLLPLFSHLIYFIWLQGCRRRSGRYRLPDYAFVSVVVFYDVGLFAEILGVRLDGHLPSVSMYSVSIQLGTCAAIALTPWLIEIGYRIAAGSMPMQRFRVMRVPVRRLPGFIFAVLAFSALGGYFALPLLSSSTLWAARTAVGETLGPFAILLYLPLYALAFVVQAGRVPWSLRVGIVIGAVSVAAISTMPLGQRTLVLLPVVLVLASNAILAGRLSRLATAGLLLATGAAILLPYFKWQHAEANSTLSLLLAVVTSDLSRANVLSDVLNRAAALGPTSVPFLGSGYVYSLLFFVPRNLAPFKGSATAIWYTGDVLGIRPDSLTWGFGIGMVEESVLNFGLAMAPIALCCYGAALRLLERLSIKYRTTFIPSALAAIWLCGYHLPAIFMLFGGMIAVCIFFEHLFADRFGGKAELPHIGKLRGIETLNPAPGAERRSNGACQL